MSEESASLTLRVIVNGAMGVATTTGFDDEEIARTASLAREAAKHSNPVQGFKGLYRDNEPAVGSRLQFDEADGHARRRWTKARALRAMFDRARDVQFAGAYATGVASVACGNTHGVRRYAHDDATPTPRSSPSRRHRLRLRDAARAQRGATSTSPRSATKRR